MPIWLQAGAWGLLAGGALVLGALIAWFVRVPTAVTAGVMAFGAGVLISALAFDLVDEAHAVGGLGPTLTGFAIGSLTYVAANLLLARRGAQHRKRSGNQQPSEDESSGSGMAIALGALLDGIPESVVLGVSLLGGGGVGVGVVVAIFISNLPEGLSSAAGMKTAGRSARYIFGVWVGIAVLSGIAALVGALALRNASASWIALITAVAAGAILAMLADTMIPEAFEGARNYAGLLTAVGFLVAYAIGEASDDSSSSEPATSSAHAFQQAGIRDHGQGERLVPDTLEQDDQALPVLRAQHAAVAPLEVADGAPRRVRIVRG